VAHAARAIGRLAGRSLPLLLWVSLAAAQPMAPAGGAPPPGSGPIQLEGLVRAVAGDTLDAWIPQGRIAIGIVGIKAPPGNTPCGREASAYLQGLVTGGGVTLTEEPGLGFDERSRRLYHVLTGDGRSVAEEMVAAGFARANGEGSARDRLAELEATARAEGRGCLRAGGDSP
jgi:endonuclease YncB( thermonuclease family)